MYHLTLNPWWRLSILDLSSSGPQAWPREPFSPGSSWHQGEMREYALLSISTSKVPKVWTSSPRGGVRGPLFGVLCRELEGLVAVPLLCFTNLSQVWS